MGNIPGLPSLHVATGGGVDAMRDYPPLSDGQPVLVPVGGGPVMQACCDCSLVHRVQYTHVGEGIVVAQYWRDKKETARLRRKK